LYNALYAIIRGKQVVTTARETQLWANFHRLNDGDKDLVIHLAREIKERDIAKAVRPVNTTFEKGASYE
jgi:hypothetical protein